MDTFYSSPDIWGELVCTYRAMFPGLVWPNSWTGSSLHADLMYMMQSYIRQTWNSWMTGCSNLEGTKLLTLKKGLLSSSIIWTTTLSSFSIQTLMHQTDEYTQDFCNNRTSSWCIQPGITKGKIHDTQISSYRDECKSTSTAADDSQWVMLSKCFLWEMLSKWFLWDQVHLAPFHC
jgi:hypothetical protein